MATVEASIRRHAGEPARIPEGTVVELFFGAVERYGRPDAVKVKREGAWRELSHERIADDVERLALGLKALGLKRGDRVGILSETRPEWHLADFASMMLGCVTVPVYATLPTEAVGYILRDSGARAVFASSPEQVEKVRPLRSSCPALGMIIAFDPPAGGAADVLPLDLVFRRGGAEIAAGRDGDYRQDAFSARPHDLLTIVYTSGTTGQPKGVMLTHNNLASNARSVMHVLPVGSEDVAVTFLPLSHILERTATYVFFGAGVSLCYCESRERLAEAMLEVRPTVMTGVPRVYEKLYDAVQKAVQEASPWRARLFRWGEKVAAEWTERKLKRRPIGAGLALRHAVADRLVYHRVRARVGGRLRFFVSGGAPMGEHLAKYFYGFGLHILEGYGLTETSPVIAVNRPDDFRFGTVGKPIPGVEVAIAGDGEILTRGPHVMKGYTNRPEDTAQAIDPDGWFHTGDVGDLDENGFLRITDRKKDIIVTAGGKNIAPQPIEDRVRRNPYVSEVLMVADRRPYPVLLVLPNFEALQKWARDRGIDAGDRQHLIGDRRVREFMERQVLDPLADLASFERPKKIGLLASDFSIESGEMTPTLKLKRRIVEEKYREIIERLYAA
ncbi:MAG: long-chain fatty acid--CoA ligase [Gemmatimonadetes bacterium]|nr:long-chain fatty acid--CoA ligase [Gemmatimonadota bacterium]